MKTLNLPSRRSRNLGLTLFVASLSLGCGVDNQSLGTIQEMVSTVSTSSPNGKRESSLPTVTSESIESTFTPPYPERDNAFEFPGSADQVPSTEPTMNSVSEIKVLGFANVGQSMVLLSYRSVTKSMSVGETFEGIEILSIQPPRVELKMGSLVWTATMFDRSR